MNNNPILNIKELALLKTTPEEYFRKNIDIIKHPVTEYARRVGNNAKEHLFQLGDKKYRDIEYSDGTKITYELLESKSRKVRDEVELEMNDTIRSVIDDIEHEYPLYEDTLEAEILRQHPELDEIRIDDIPDWGYGGMTVPIERTEYIPEREEIITITTKDGETINFLDSADDLEGIKGSAESKLTSSDQKHWRECCDVFKDEIGEKHDIFSFKHNRLKQGIRGSIEGKDPEEALMNWELSTPPSIINDRQRHTENTNLGKFAINEFNDVLSQNNIPEKTPSFATVEYKKDLGKGEGVEKGIVTNSGIRLEHATRESIMENGETSDWKIITIQGQGNPARRGARVGETGWMTGKGQKNERRIIDTERKVIIQTPYEPGMERHIYG